MATATVPPETLPPNRAAPREPSKMQLRTQQVLDMAQPAVDWVRGVADAPMRALRSEFGRIVLIIFLVMIVGANVIWLLERSDADNAFFSPNYLVGIGDAVWYVIVTIATVGYGDKTPITAGGRLIGGLLIVAGVVLVSLFTATTSSLLVARRIKEGDTLDAETLTDHTVLCGWNRNVPRFLTALSRAGERDVVLINEAANDVIEPHLKAYAGLRLLFVRGTFTQESILASAGIKRASHAVLMPDESSGGSEEGDEQKTVLASLVIKEMNPQIKIFAHVLKREDAAHVKRAKADEVIVTDEFTGELLANHVAHPGAPQALAELMSVDTSHAVRAIDIPQAFVGSTIGAYIQYLHENGNMLLMGFAVREEGFGLTQAMQGGSDYITEFIQQQVQAAGISMSTDERIVVRLNPPQDYVIGAKHSALVMT
jgi:voltage-gated potassium channel